MKSFEYVIKDSLGIHARAAGMLVKEVKKYESKITIAKDGKEIDASKLMALMALAVKCGHNVTITCDGADEETACAELLKFFEENL